MSKEDPLIQMAAARAMQPEMQQAPPPQARGIGVSANDLINLVAVCVLSPEQCFNLMFKGEQPAEFQGPDSAAVKAKAEKEIADRAAAAAEKKE